MDLNVMMLEQARAGLQTELDAAVTAGDTEAARKVGVKIAELAARTAPKAAPFTSADVWKAAEAKADWLGVDPKKSATANEFAKTMNPSRFATAEAMAEAVIKAVDEEYKKPPTPGEGEGEAGGEGEGEAEGEDKPKPAAKPKRTDGPGENDVGAGSGTRRASGPWTKLSDAPADVQKDINRTADKYVPKGADKAVRDRYVADALSSHYQIHQRTKGKK